MSFTDYLNATSIDDLTTAYLLLENQNVTSYSSLAEFLALTRQVVSLQDVSFTTLTYYPFASMTQEVGSGLVTASGDGTVQVVNSAVYEVTARIQSGGADTFDLQEFVDGSSSSNLINLGTDETHQFLYTAASSGTVDLRIYNPGSTYSADESPAGGAGFGYSFLSLRRVG